MEIICIFGKGGRIEFWYVSKRFVFGRRYDMGFAVAGGFVVRFGSPLPRQNVICFAAAVHQVKRNHGKLRRSASLQKQDFIIIRDFHHFAE